jgi:hypothetical protein
MIVSNLSALNNRLDADILFLQANQIFLPPADLPDAIRIVNEAQAHLKYARQVESVDPSQAVLPKFLQNAWCVENPHALGPRLMDALLKTRTISELLQSEREEAQRNTERMLRLLRFVAERIGPMRILPAVPASGLSLRPRRLPGRDPRYID